MLTKTKIALFQYFILIAILVVGFNSVLLFKEQPVARIVSVIVMAFAYFLWGTYRHLFTKPFHPKIVIEYAMFAVSIAVLLITILSVT